TRKSVSTINADIALNLTGKSKDLDLPQSPSNHSLCLCHVYGFACRVYAVDDSGDVDLCRKRGKKVSSASMIPCKWLALVAAGKVRNRWRQRKLVFLSIPHCLPLARTVKPSINAAL